MIEQAEERRADGPDCTVVIPAFNEHGGIASSVAEIAQALGSAGLRHEIVVIDDGSTDGTAAAASQTPCRVIRSKTNCGYGASLKKGIAAAHSDVIVITDADGTYPANRISELVARAREADMVVGARTGEAVHIPWARRPAKWLLTRLSGYLCGKPIPDLNSGLRVFRKRDFHRFARIVPNGFSFTTTMTLAYLCNGLSVDYVPIDYRKRVGNSKIRPGHAYDFLILILRVIVLFNPLKVVLPVGSFLAVIGLIKFGYDLFIGSNLSETAVLCSLGAIIIWSVGLLADQNSRLAVSPEPVERGD
jgi:glycosyltransferase involved in cell wall biosynthesis